MLLPSLSTLTVILMSRTSVNKSNSLARYFIRITRGRELLPTSSNNSKPLRETLVPQHSQFLRTEPAVYRLLRIVKSSLDHRHTPSSQTTFDSKSMIDLRARQTQLRLALQDRTVSMFYLQKILNFQASFTPLSPSEQHPIDSQSVSQSDKSHEDHK
jgi:hypothetical protein